MIIYIFVILWVMVFAGLAQHIDINTTPDNRDKLDVSQLYKDNGKYHSLNVCYAFILSSFALIFVGGGRYFVGTDYGSYYRLFNDYAESLMDSALKLDEPGYHLICKLIKIMGGNDGAYPIIVASILTIGITLYIIYQNSNQLLLASILYLFTCWTVSFNAIRQCLATTFVFCGYRAIKERRLWEYVLWVFIGFLFHRSAVCLIFPYFFIYNDLTLRNMLFLFLGCIVFLYSYDRVFNITGVILDKEFINIEYGSYNFKEVNRLRIIVHCVPAIFFLPIIFRQKKRILDNQKFWINILLFSAAISIAAMNSPYLLRIRIFFSPFVVLAISGLINELKTENKKLISLIISIFYGIFFLYETYSSYTLHNYHFIWER